MSEIEIQQSLDGSSGALLSQDGKYRYGLWRLWEDPIAPKDIVAFVMLNPSTADGLKDDPTIRKCVKFAKRYGGKGLVVVNLFAYRATDPKVMKAAGSEAIGPENNEMIFKQLEGVTTVVAAWGHGGKYFDREEAFLASAKARGVKLKALKLSKDGTPQHPLYQKDETDLIDYGAE